MEAANAYLRDLRDKLRDANRRLESADEEGAPVVRAQIREIERDIREAESWKKRRSTPS